MTFDESLHERASLITPEEYVRAYSLLGGEEEAKRLVDEQFGNLRADPSMDLVLGPRMLALLALFSDEGKRQATATMSADRIRQLQRELCREYPSIGKAFPQVLAGDDSRGSA